MVVWIYWGSDGLTMTNDQRDRLINQTHIICERLAKVIEGNGQAGLSDRVTVIENNQENCAAREAYAGESKRSTVANLIQIGMLAACIVAAWAAWQR